MRPAGGCISIWGRILKPKRFKAGVQGFRLAFGIDRKSKALHSRASFPQTEMHFRPAHKPLDTIVKSLYTQKGFILKR
jgi:hypothetical protein